LNLDVRIENPRGVVGAKLIAELSADLGARYGDDGSGRFDPADVEVARAAFVVAWLDGEPVGCGALRPMDEDAAEIKRMYVCPAARGKGISKKILHTLEVLARDFGYQVVRLETGVRQPEAIHVYEKSGYQRIANYGPYVGSERNLCFEKSLV
jgi:putative acetyltransferase